jgi:succinyl-diaminopimelate desuccinylase
MDEQQARLIELDRQWAREVPPIPPVAETEATIATRLREVDEARRTVFAVIDQQRDQTIELLREMVRIPSVNPSEGFEQEMAAYSARAMRELGMTVQEVETAPQRGNALGKVRFAPPSPPNPGGEPAQPATGLPPLLGGGGGPPGPSLLFYAHIDTVPVGDPSEWTYPPFSATIADGRIWGRGAKDCKLGLAAALQAIRALRDAGAPVRGEAQIAAVADEEMGGHLGIAQLIDRDLIHADYAIYGEGYPNRVTIGHKGWVNLKLTTRGRTSHTAAKSRGVNAILSMCRLAPIVEDLSFPGWEPHPVVASPPVASVNVIQGGFKVNVVPDRCSITVDVRYPPGMTHETVLGRVRDVLAEARARDPGIGEVDVELTNLARPSFMQPDEPLVRWMSRAVQEVTGVDPRPEGMEATSDSRWILLDAGVPIVNFSMGNDSGHRPNEWCGIEDLIQNVKIYALMGLLLLQ